MPDRGWSEEGNVFFSTRRRWVGIAGAMAIIFAGLHGKAMAADTVPPSPATPAPSVVAPTPKPSSPASSGQLLNLTARPVAAWSGYSQWKDRYKSVTDCFKALNDALAKAGIKPTGRPMILFTETDDEGFKFQGEIPIDKPKDGKTDLGGGVTIAEQPAGKVLKFQYRGSFDDTDSTYIAINAYIDEQGYEVDNRFIEEYLNDIKGPDDPNQAIDIYIYIK